MGKLPAAAPAFRNDDADLVIPKTVDVVFVNEEAGVVDQELTDFALSEREDRSDM